MNSVTAIDAVIKEYWSVYKAEQAQAEYDELKSRVDTAEAIAKEYQATVEAYRDNQAQLEKDVKAMLEALRYMLYIFDRELPEGTIGRQACDEAIAAMMGQMD